MVVAILVSSVELTLVELSVVEEVESPTVKCVTIS